MSKYDLLSIDRDAKSKKGKAWGWLTAMLYLAPAKESGHEMCGGRTPQCTFGCLNISGYSEVYPAILEARIRKTLDYIRDFSGFCDRLERDTEKFLVEAENRGLKPCERLNGTSDQPKVARAMARRFPRLPFYDYTKLLRPWERLMDNYHLTYSFSGENLNHCMRCLEHGVNVAVVFRGAKPRQMAWRQGHRRRPKRLEVSGPKWSNRWT